MTGDLEEELYGATPLDPDEREGLKHPHITTRAELNHLESANISSGLLWLGCQRAPNILTDEFSRKLHKQLFGEVWRWAGTYRKTEKNIGVDPIRISVEHRILLDDAKYWVDHETYSSKEAAARFHHRLVYIHPFPNGNGRHARIMADAYIEKIFNEAPIEWGGENILNSESKIRKQYIDALGFADNGDYLPLFKFVGL